MAISRAKCRFISRTTIILRTTIDSLPPQARYIQSAWAIVTVLAQWQLAFDYGLCNHKSDNGGKGKSDGILILMIGTKLPWLIFSQSTPYMQVRTVRTTGTLFESSESFQ